MDVWILSISISQLGREIIFREDMQSMLQVGGSLYDFSERKIERRIYPWRGVWIDTLSLSWKLFTSSSEMSENYSTKPHIIENYDVHSM